ncbi:MAG: 30S ribosomal protein S6 [Spirochaetota bacterium]
MRKYEYLYIIDPQEEVVRRTIDGIKEQYQSRGVNLLQETEMGKRRLAYEIDRKTDGYYYVTQVETDDYAGLQEFETDVKLNPDVIRFMRVKL